jgi:hypothetical protein
MTLTRTTFAIRCIDASVVSALHEIDDSGHAPDLLVDDEGGHPLRCCLRQSRPGEQIALVSYAPLRRWAQGNHVDVGAYDEVGPIFIHAEPCAGPVDDGYPAELRGSPRMLRAYSERGRILRGVLVEANGPFEEALEELLSDSQVAMVHARALEFGCFTFEVRRR